MTINKGLFAHIVVTLILIAGYRYVLGLRDTDFIDLFTSVYTLALINAFMSAHFCEYGIYTKKIKIGF
jgi:hypothetical protein